MKYTEQEEKELNKQLKKWQDRQLRAVRKNNIDTVFEKMSKAESSIWEIIAKAESHKDVSPYVWDLADSVISKFCKMAKD